MPCWSRARWVVAEMDRGTRLTVSFCLVAVTTTSPMTSLLAPPPPPGLPAAAVWAMAGAASTDELKAVVKSRLAARIRLVIDHPLWVKRRRGSARLYRP